MRKIALRAAGDESAAEQPAASAAVAVVPQKARQARLLVPAMAGLIILGFAVVGLAWWTLHRVRRRLRHRLGPTQPVRDPWYQKPEPGELPTEPEEREP